MTHIGGTNGRGPIEGSGEPYKDEGATQSDLSNSAIQQSHELNTHHSAIASTKDPKNRKGNAETEEIGDNFSQLVSTTASQLNSSSQTGIPANWQTAQTRISKLQKGIQQTGLQPPPMLAEARLSAYLLGLKAKGAKPPGEIKDLLPLFSVEMPKDEKGR